MILFLLFGMVKLELETRPREDLEQNFIVMDYHYSKIFPLNQLKKRLVKLDVFTNHRSFICAMRNHYNCRPLTSEEESSFSDVSAMIAAALAFLFVIVWFFFRILSGFFETAG